MNIYYLGPQKSYSYILAKQSFSGGLYKLTALPTAQAVVDRIKVERDCIGVLPIENSITSSVHENFDLAFEGDIHIVGEANLQVKLHLIGLEQANLEQLTTVHSHPKALAQCSEFIKSHNLAQIDHNSTSAALEEIITNADPSQAAIGSSELVVPGTTKMLKESIGNQSYNLTRFIFISQEKNSDNSANNKMTLTFKVKHEPGSLAKVLTRLAEIEHTNLTKIESRPIPGTTWEYNFWVDIEVDNNKIPEILETIKQETLEHNILGIYEIGKTYSS